MLYLFWYACSNIWTLKLHARAPKIESITVTNQQETLGLLAVIKQQQILQHTVKLRAFLWSKTDPKGKLDRT